MEFLAPLTLAYAAAVAVPMLLLLYFLKLKRTEQFVPCTLLWKRAVQDLQVNAPFQRIRRNILLLLQLLALLAVLLALGKPVLSLTGGPPRRYVLLIDRSASMETSDIRSGVTRLEEAKEQAKTFVKSLRGRDFFSLARSGDEVMIVAFDEHPKVICNFTSDKRRLLPAIDSINGSHKRSSLSEALMVARAFAQSPGVEANNRSSQEHARLILFSDGRIRDTNKIVIGEDELIFNCIGHSHSNLAITAMRARRSYENPADVEVFATVTNYGEQEVVTDVQLSLNGDVRAVRSVTVPARSPGGRGEPNKPGRVAVGFSLTYAETGVLEIRHLHQDVLSCDDAAWAILPLPKKLSVLLVSRGNPVMESALRACPLEQLKIVSPNQFDQMDHAAMSVEQPFNVIVIDNCRVKNLPTGRYLVFGRPPDGIDVTISGRLKNQLAVDWRARHAILQHVNLTNLFVAECYKLDLPRDADVLAEFNETAAVALLRRSGSVFLLVGFDALQSNWPFEPGFVLFFYNALSYLSIEFGQEQQYNVEVGQPLIIEGLPPETDVVVDGPGINNLKIKTDSAGTISVPATERVGIYTLSPAGGAAKVFAVNLLDQQESNIEPLRRLKLSGREVKAQQQTVARANVPLWPHLVGLALALVFLEWLVYNSKVRI